MDSPTIARLLRPFVSLDKEQLDKTAAYLDLLLQWNSRTNLTAVREPQEIVRRHFGESFFAAGRLLAENETTVIDLGSGAGFPGLPMAILAPAAHMTLLESSAKKTAFLNEVIRALRLSNVAVVRQRGEDYLGQADLVTMRAVEAFSKSAAVACGLVSSGGRLALMIGAGQVDQTRHLIPNMSWEPAIPIPGSHSRVVLVGAKPVKVGQS